MRFDVGRGLTRGVDGNLLRTNAEHGIERCFLRHILVLEMISRECHPTQHAVYCQTGSGNLCLAVNKVDARVADKVCHIQIGGVVVQLQRMCT